MKRRATRWRSAFPTPLTSRGKATLSMTVRQGKVELLLEDHADRAMRAVDDLAVDAHPALVAPDESAENIEHRGFAAARRADDGDELAALDRERHVLDGRHRALAGIETHRDVLDDQIDVTSGFGELQLGGRGGHDAFILRQSATHRNNPSSRGGREGRAPEAALPERTGVRRAGRYPFHPWTRPSSLSVCSLRASYVRDHGSVRSKTIWLDQSDFSGWSRLPIWRRKAPRL